jgi:dihydroorotate dehydrogenase (NAD+) catalytic subunit
VKPVALRCAWICARAVSIPVIGCGGVSGPDDLLEFVAAGCSLVQVGTACFAEPDLPARIARELPALLERAGFASIEALRGTIRDEVQRGTPRDGSVSLVGARGTPGASRATGTSGAH